MASVTIPVSLGGTNVGYNDGSGAYGMASNRGYGYATYLIPMLSEVIAACAITIAAAEAPPSDEASNRDLTDDDHGAVLNCTSGITLTIPSGLRSGFHCAIHQAGASQVTVAAGVGVTLRNVGSEFKTAAQYAVVGIINTASEVYNLGGSTGA